MGFNKIPLPGNDIACQYMELADAYEELKKWEAAERLCFRNFQVVGGRRHFSGTIAIRSHYFSDSILLYSQRGISRQFISKLMHRVEIIRGNQR